MNDVLVALAFTWFGVVATIIICVFAKYSLDPEQYPYVVIPLGLGLLVLCVTLIVLLHIKQFLSEPQTLFAVLGAVIVILISVHLSLSRSRW